MLLTEASGLQARLLRTQRRPPSCFPRTPRLDSVHLAFTTASPRREPSAPRCHREDQRTCVKRTTQLGPRGWPRPTRDHSCVLRDPRPSTVPATGQAHRGQLSVRGRLRGADAARPGPRGLRGASVRGPAAALTPAFGAVPCDNHMRAWSAPPRSHTRKLRLGADWPPSFRAGPRFCAAPTPPPCTPCIRGHPLPAADVVFTLLVTISGTGIWANTAVRHKRDLLKKEVLEERPSLPGKGHEKKRSLLFPWTVSRRVQCLEALRPSCYELRAAQTWWAAEQRDAPPGPANPGGFYR